PVEDAKSAQPLQIRVADARHALKSYEAALSEQRYEEALNELRKLEQLNPADPRVAEFRRRLESGKSPGGPRSRYIAWAPLAGKCDGELVLSLAGVEYRPRSGAHGFRAPFQSLKFRTEGKTIELYNAANNKEFHTFETAGDEQAEVLNRFWSALENLPR